MKLWRMKDTIASKGVLIGWTYIITDDEDQTLSIIDKRNYDFSGIFDLSYFTGESPHKIGGRHYNNFTIISKNFKNKYEIIVENFNSIEELKALVPEEFI